MCYSTMVKQSKQAAMRFRAEDSDFYFDDYQKAKSLLASLPPDAVRDELGLARKPKSEVFTWAPDQRDSRVYPGYFAPVMTIEEGKRIIRPMRYRVRPYGTPKEVPSKFNLFNCRLDMITSRRIWKPLFGKKHALFPFIRFYEWVENPDGTKQQISFFPEGRDVMWAPAIFDNWVSASGKIQFCSFAIITDDPPPEVSAAGHDRCPIFLHESAIDDWLQPEDKTTESLLALLGQREQVTYAHQPVNQSAH